MVGASGKLDLMIEFAVESLAGENHLEIAKMVREMATRWPNEPALEIVFSITSAAASLDDMVDSESSRRASQRGYQLAALVAADVYAIEAMGHCPAIGQDLLHFWRRADPYFLEL